MTEIIQDYLLSQDDKNDLIRKLISFGFCDAYKTGRDQILELFMKSSKTLDDAIKIARKNASNKDSVLYSENSILSEKLIDEITSKAFSISEKNHRLLKLISSLESGNDVSEYSDLIKEASYNPDILIKAVDLHNSFITNGIDFLKINDIESLYPKTTELISKIWSGNDDLEYV